MERMRRNSLRRTTRRSSTPTSRQGRRRRRPRTTPKFVAAKLKVVEAKGDDAAIAKAEADVAKPPSLVDAGKDAAQRREAAAKVVADLNRKFAGWTFFVPAYEFANFNKGIDELLKPLPGKGAASPAPGLKLPLPGTTPMPVQLPMPPQGG